MKYSYVTGIFKMCLNFIRFMEFHEILLFKSYKDKRRNHRFNIYCFQNILFIISDLFTESDLCKIDVEKVLLADWFFMFNFSLFYLALVSFNLISRSLLVSFVCSLP